MFLPITRLCICFLSISFILLLQYYDVQTVIILLGYLGIVCSLPHVFFSYQYKNNKTIIKRFIGFKIKELDITNKSKITIYRYWNRRKFLEDNQEEYSDKYYKFTVMDNNKSITIRSIYRNIKLLSLMDYLPESFFRKAEFVKTTNWIRFLSKNKKNRLTTVST